MIGGKFQNMHSTYTVPPKHNPKIIHQNISTLWSNNDSFSVDMFSLIQVKNSEFQTKMIPLFNQLYRKCNPKEKKFINIFVTQAKQIDFVPYEIVNDQIVLKKRPQKGGVNDNVDSIDINDDRVLNRQLQQHTRDMIQSEDNLELQKSKIELMNNIVKLMQDQQNFCQQSQQSNWNVKNMLIIFNLLFTGTILYTTKNAANIVLSGVTVSTIKFVNTTMGMTRYLINPILGFINSTSRIPDGTEIMSKLTDMTNTMKDDPELQPFLEALYNTGMGLTVLSFIIIFIFTSFITFLIRMCLYADNISFMGLFSISTNHSHHVNTANQNTMVQMLQHVNLDNTARPQLPPPQNKLEYNGGYSRISNRKKHSIKKKAPRKTKNKHTKKTRLKKN
jgi:hypothetical protein